MAHRRIFVFAAIAILVMSGISLIPEAKGEKNASPPQINIDNPKPSYIYIIGRPILPLPGFIHADAIVIGSVKIKASASDECGISDMKLYIDNKLEYEGSSIEYNWNEFSFKRHVIKVEARDKLGNEISKEINVLLINF